MIAPPTLTVLKSLIDVPSPLNRLPLITVIGKFGWMLAYPLTVHRYKPFSMPTLQTRPSAAARAVPDVPSAIVAIRLANAHATRKPLVMFLSNFVFMIIFLSNFLFSLWLSLAPRRE